MALLAVIDARVLAPWAEVKLPPRAGLLNVFYDSLGDTADEDIRAGHCITFNAPEDWCVLPAAPDSAVEAMPPAGRLLLPSRPVAAEQMVALPDVGWTDPPVGDEQVWDALARICRRLPEVLEDGDDAPFWNVPPEVNDNPPAIDNHRVFAWPWSMQGGPVCDQERVHLLQLASDEAWMWGDCGMVTFDIPESALRAGDFSQVDCYIAYT